MIDESNARNLLDRMLHPGVDGAAILRTQLTGLLIRVIDANGSYKLEPVNGTPWGSIRGVIVDAEAQSADGAQIYALLHCRDGLLDELEFYRGDGLVVSGRLESHDFEVVFPRSTTS